MASDTKGTKRPLTPGQMRNTKGGGKKTVSDGSTGDGTYTEPTGGSGKGGSTSGGTKKGGSLKK